MPVTKFRIICSNNNKIINQNNDIITLVELEKNINEKRILHTNLLNQLQELKIKINEVLLKNSISKLLIYGIFSEVNKRKIEFLKEEKENILKNISENFVEIFYELDEKNKSLFTGLDNAENEILACKEIRNIDVNPYNKTYKEIVCKWSRDNYSFVKCNFDCLYFGDTNDKLIYFFPSFFLIDDGVENSDIHLYHLNDSSLRYETEEIEEYGYVPSDAKKIDETWMYQTKIGEKDLRYNNNRKIPVIEYAAIHLKINKIIEEKYRVSNLSKAKNFVETYNNYVGKN